MTISIRRGTQVAYIPSHADGDITHANVEFGFVTSVREDIGIVFCRYWSQQDPNQLRTRANSEATPLDNIVLHTLHPQEKIDRLLGQIEKNKGRTE